MPNYTTTTKLKARFEDDRAVAAATDTLESTGAPDEAVLDECVRRGESIFDSYVCLQNAVPVDVSSDAVLADFCETICTDLAENCLLERGDQVSEAKQRRHERNTERLKEIAKGEVLLPSSTTLPSTSTKDPLVAFGTAGTGDTSERLFSRRTQSGV